MLVITSAFGSSPAKPAAPARAPSWAYTPTPTAPRISALSITMSVDDRQVAS